MRTSRTSRGLRPPQLDTLGLTNTLDQMAQEFARTCGLECVTDVAAADHAVPPDAEIHVYRIVQECLNNVVEHANATRAEVVVTRTDRGLEISVSDNGIGFHRESVELPASNGHGFGLMGIRERARILNGELDIRSGPGQGTAVLVTIALESGA
jgi:signal transduction histidine kinase